MNDDFRLVLLAALGAAVGTLAVLLWKVTTRTRILVDVVAGVIGALCAAWLSESNGTDWETFLLAVLGAAFVIGLERIALGGPG